MDKSTQTTATLLNMADWMTTCGCCGSSDPSLRRCGRCFKAYYCSNTCQAQDWPRHKSTCSKQAGSADGQRGSSSKLADQHTGNSGYPNGKENYRDQEADIADGTGNNASASAPASGNCGACAQDGCSLKCAKCKDVFYCSRYCQRTDWPQHKQACKKTSQTSGATGQPGQDDPTAALRRRLMMRQMGILPPEIADVETPRPPGSLEKAKRFAKTNLSLTQTQGMKIVDDLREIPWESYGPGLRPIVLVAYIFKLHPYAVRHMVCIKDRKDAEIRVAFYLDHDDPKGFFSYSDLVPGNYLCLDNPYKHTFMDGTMGIRIDEPSMVAIIPIDKLG